MAAMLLESIKCRLACAFCHEFGNVPGYEEKLKQVSQLQYNFGSQHRTAAEGLGIKEMALFIPEIKSRGSALEREGCQSFMENTRGSSLAILQGHFDRFSLLDE